ncbi:glycosyltransferase family 2 protein [Loigolactobacillus coryniformis]|jgi:GT2 family glycosyltransferase|uniref:Glycosyl transferase, group 2 family protein n=1 Tax=Loigolactobacillus coryniformis subsp. coryniformis KCTC 3167 = DSM 20001 TaxID=913848 RepID=A0A0R1FJP0_9LACO|nr:glycosyltransferase [Loigolactobacillus coryniformis]KRK19314.1 glycosyl transferase, group 2 family protein [Loigolactobacillus coryniformis subsp. coryniformis KCTC 3167 = DSM 20001]
MEKTMRLTAIIVLYEISADTAQTIRSLQAMKKTAAWAMIRQIHFVIFDNSKQAQLVPTQLLPNFEYYHSQRNVGLAAAYNQALAIAVQQNSDYLLLLDQDTKLTPSYLAELFTAVTAKVQPIAIVPKIQAAGQLISPIRAAQPFKVIPVTSGYQNEVTAINSAACFRVDFLQQCGGFELQFPLDFLDYWLFYQVRQTHQPVLVLQSQLMHELSVMHTQSISTARYQGIIRAEWLYYHRFQKISSWQYWRHVWLRLFSQLILKRDFAKVKLLLKWMIRRKPSV